MEKDYVLNRIKCSVLSEKSSPIFIFITFLGV